MKRQINTRVDEGLAKSAQKAALDHDHDGWSEILTLALALYVERYAAEQAAGGSAA